MVRFKNFVLAATSGVLLALAFPKAELSLLAWVAFVPLFWAIRKQTTVQSFISGWVAGMGFYLCTFYWVVSTLTSYSTIPPIMAVGLLLFMDALLALYTGAFSAGLRFYQQRGGSILLLASPLWVLLEWVRSFFLIGFPWASLGYSQYRDLNLIQFAEITGVYGISALVIFVNVLVFTALRTRWFKCGGLFLVAAVLVLGLSSWGSWRRTQIATLPAAHSLRIGVIQGNVEQDRKWDHEFREATITRYEQLTRQAATQGVDLIIWPETAVPFFFQSDVVYRDRLLKLSNEIKVPLLFGSPAFRQTGTETALVNRAYLISPNAEVLGVYDKMQLAPFGEYIPFARVLFFLDQLVEGLGALTAGTVPTVFSHPSAKFSVLICYESIFPTLARHFVMRGSNFLINITNDAWFGRTSAPYQHFMMATLRAVENRVPVVRAANTGFSAFIDLDGQVHAKTALYETTFLVKEIAWSDVGSFYTIHGDLFAWLCTLMAGSLLGRSIGRRHMRKLFGVEKIPSATVCLERIRAAPG